MSDNEHESDSPLSQLSIEDDEVVWTHSSSSDTDFIVLHHPLLDAHSLPSTGSDSAGHPDSDGDLYSALDRISLCDHNSLVSSPSTGAESDSDHAPPGNRAHSDKLMRGKASSKTRCRAQSSSVASTSSEYHSGASTPTASYDEASTFITRFISSSIKGSNLDLLRALIVELGLRPPNASDLPCTLTSARKMLKAEAHVNIKEYVATRHKGQSALREILKPSKNALRKDIGKGNGASLQWVKQRGLQVLLVTCST